MTIKVLRKRAITHIDWYMDENLSYIHFYNQIFNKRLARTLEVLVEEIGFFTIDIGPNEEILGIESLETEKQIPRWVLNHHR